MLLELIRAQTRSSHQSLEKLLIPKLKATKTRDGYARLLAIFYGYFSPLEEQIQTHLSVDTLPDLYQRRKAAAILEDYKKISADRTDIAICNDLPEIKNEGEALAAMYVLEGSTLGGKVIAQMLSTNLGIAEDEGIRFFNGYRNETKVMWDRFTEVLDHYPTVDNSGESLAQTADETFIKFKNWIELN